MKEKEKKGFFSRLFFAEPKMGCCNVQFEEISNENDTPESKSNNKTEDKGNIEKEQLGKLRRTTLKIKHCE